MALEAHALLTSGSTQYMPSKERVVPGPGPGAIKTCVYGPVAADPLLARLEPVAMVDGKVVPWAYVDGNQTENTAEVIVGFVWSEEVQLDAVNDTNGNVLVIGQVDYRDVVLRSGQGTQNQLEAALKALTLRQRGLQITGGLGTTL